MNGRWWIVNSAADAASFGSALRRRRSPSGRRPVPAGLREHANPQIARAEEGDLSSRLAQLLTEARPRGRGGAMAAAWTYLLSYARSTGRQR